MLEKNMKELVQELETCNFCGVCEKSCSIFLNMRKYSPHEKLLAVREILESKEKPQNWESVFLCTKCEACDECCPKSIPISKIIDLGRNVCVEKWGIQYERQKEVIGSIFELGNPFFKTESRTQWLEDEIKENSRTLLHLGCMISYPLSSMGQSIIRILKKLKIDFTISPNERCCGYFIYNTGNHKDSKALIKQNMQEFEKYDEIIAACAGCYTFLKEFYPLKNRLKHIVEVILEKLEDLKIDTEVLKKKVVFQDSCHIARPHKITEEPRQILKKMGYEISEFDKLLCCGADGGMRIINPSLAVEIGKNRLLEAKEKSNLFFTLCPFCIHNFRDAAEKFQIDIQIKSIFEELEKLI